MLQLPFLGERVEEAPEPWTGVSYLSLIRASSKSQAITIRAKPITLENWPAH
jgi:hypothetical protein